MAAAAACLLRSSANIGSSWLRQPASAGTVSPCLCLALPCQRHCQLGSSVPPKPPCVLLLARTYQLGGGPGRHPDGTVVCVRAGALLLRPLAQCCCGLWRSAAAAAAASCRARALLLLACRPPEGEQAVRAPVSQVWKWQREGARSLLQAGPRLGGEPAGVRGQARLRGWGRGSGASAPGAAAALARNAPAALAARPAPPDTLVGLLLRAAARSLRPRHTRARPRPAALPHVPSRSRH
jgi:hypothetical protein